VNTASFRPVALAILLLGGGATFASGQAVRGVLGNGGTTMSNGGVVLHGTAGQAAVGLSAGPGVQLSHGFWGYAGSQVVGVAQPPGVGTPQMLMLGGPARLRRAARCGSR